MSLNYDCIRDLLFALENELEQNKCLSIESISRTFLMRNYSFEEIELTALKLSETEYIDISYTLFVAFRNSIEVRRKYTEIDFNTILPEGIKFLDSVRDERIWKEAKNNLKKIGNPKRIEVIPAIANKKILCNN